MFVIIMFCSIDNSLTIVNHCFKEYQSAEDFVSLQKNFDSSLNAQNDFIYKIVEFSEIRNYLK